MNNKLFLRDPQDTELGIKIIQHSVELIDQLGFEHFTFKKLAQTISSTEASIYRYFENKNRLLIYIVSSYWIWIDYKIQFHTQNLKDPKEKLKIILAIICHAHPDTIKNYINEEALHRIVISESAKSYLIKEVDEINKYGVYYDYKLLNKKIAEVLLAINPKYDHANSLVSTVIESAHHQHYFSSHLPSLTNFKNDENKNKNICEFLEGLISNCLSN